MYVTTSFTGGRHHQLSNNIHFINCIRCYVGILSLYLLEVHTQVLMFYAELGDVLEDIVHSYHANFSF